MPKFRIRMRDIEAFQWFKNGDHPKDNCGTFVDSDGQPQQGEGHVVRYFRHPAVPGKDKCPKCGDIWHNHGWIDKPGGGENVCPGDWIIEGDDEFYVCDKSVFEALYEEVC